MKAYRYNKFIHWYQCQNGCVPIRDYKDNDVLIVLYRIDNFTITVPALAPIVLPIKSTATGYSFIYYMSQWNSRLTYENLWKWELQGY